VHTKLNAGVEPSLPFAIGQLDAVDQIAGHSVGLAAIVEQSGERRELAVAAGFEVLAPGDNVGRA
jgi:hypothetical protein